MVHFFSRASPWAMDAFRAELLARSACTPATADALCAGLAKCADEEDRYERMAAVLLEAKHYTDRGDAWALTAGEVPAGAFRKPCGEDAEARNSYARHDELMVEEEKGNVVDVACSRCSGKNIRWTQEQTRSADEPAVSRFRCLKCGHTWVG